jgi:hypothetical protein
VTDQPSDHDGMTDEELDQLLTTANRELLGHIQRVADPDATLTAIMTLDAKDRGDQTSPAAQAIAIRARATDVPDVLDRARDNARDLTNALDDALDGALAAAFDIDIARDHARSLADAVADAADLATDDLVLDNALNSARDLTNALDSDMASASDLANDIRLANDVANNLELVRQNARTNLDSPRARVLDYARDLARILARDLGRAHVLDSAHALDRADAGALNSARVLADNIHDARALVRDLGRELETELATAGDLASNLVRVLADNIHDARALVHALSRTLTRARDLSSAFAHELLAQQVNAAGADLSALKIERVEILEGVTWTDQTRWPPRIKELVQEASEEIGDGVYQVRTGDAPDRSYVPSM